MAKGEVLEYEFAMCATGQRDPADQHNDHAPYVSILPFWAPRINGRAQFLFWRTTGTGAIIFTDVIGKLVDVYGAFTGPLVIAGVLPLVAYAAFVLVAGPIRPVQFGETAANDRLRS